MSSLKSECELCLNAPVPYGHVTGVGGKRPKYLIVLDTPKSRDRFFGMLKRAIEHTKLSSQDFFVTYMLGCELVRDHPAVSAGKEAKKWLDQLIYEKPSISRILILGKTAADVISDGRFVSLSRNSRRWFTATFGEIFVDWVSNNRSKKAYKNLTTDELFQVASLEKHIVDTPITKICMLGQSEAVYTGDPAQEGVFYEDIEYFTSHDPNHNSRRIENFYDGVDYGSSDKLLHVSFDTETDSKHIRSVSTIRCIGVAYELARDGESGIIQNSASGGLPAAFCDETTRYTSIYDRSGGDFGRFASATDEKKRDGALARSLLETHGLTKIGFNIKYDLHVLRKAGVRVNPPYVDVKVMLHLVAEHLKERDLKTALRRFLPEFPHHDADVVSFKTINTGGNGYEDIPMHTLSKYCVGDTVGTLGLYKKLKSKLTPKQEAMLYLESKFLELIYQMECSGFYISTDKLITTRFKVREEIDQLKKSLLSYGDINWNSRDQVLRVLPFLKDLKKETLKKHKDYHPAVGVLTNYKKLVKLNSTYLENWESYCEPIDDKHTRLTYEFRQDGARSGRMSAINPAVQTIPRKSVVREMFVSRYGPNGVLLEVDASQLEYRFMAFASQDPLLIEAYSKGSDMHKETASIFGIDRDKAKTVNFLTLFGGGDYKLAQELGISKERAGEFIKTLFTRYAGVKAYIDKTKAFVKDSGYVESMFGRIRRLGWGRDRKEQGHLERAGLNMTIQGPAADYVKACILSGLAAMQKDSDNATFGYVPVLTVHDSIVFDCDCYGTAMYVFDYMKKAFENPNSWAKKLFGIEFNIPFTAEGKIGKNYRDMEEIKL